MYDQIKDDSIKRNNKDIIVGKNYFIKNSIYFEEIEVNCLIWMIIY